MKISPHFDLIEFTRSQTAARNGIDNTPSEAIIQNLTDLANNFLEGLRAKLGAPIRISSGYRCLELNTAIGGSKTSDHINGKAADIIVPGFRPIEVCRIIRDMDLYYDQNIHEFGQWTHLGIGDRRRRQDLTAYRKDGKTQYANGLHEIEDL